MIVKNGDKPRSRSSLLDLTCMVWWMEFFESRKKGMTSSSCLYYNP